MIGGSTISLHDRKIVVVGKSGSGKTCLVKLLTESNPAESLAKHKPTVDESYFTFHKALDGELLQLQFIDTAPWMEFPAMHRLYIQTSQLAILVYDTASKTWKEDLLCLIKDVKEISSEIEIVVAGTNCDQANVMTNLTPAHVQEVLGSLRHVYFSSMTGFGLQHLWSTILHTKAMNYDNTLIKQPDSSSCKSCSVHEIKSSLLKFTCGLMRSTLRRTKARSSALSN